MAMRKAEEALIDGQISLAGFIKFREIRLLL
jgi:hypothetical protein